eukprot:gene8004-12314_t
MATSPKSRKGIAGVRRADALFLATAALLFLLLVLVRGRMDTLAEADAPATRGPGGRYFSFKPLHTLRPDAQRAAEREEQRPRGAAGGDAEGSAEEHEDDSAGSDDQNEEHDDESAGSDKSVEKNEENDEEEEQEADEAADPREERASTGHRAQRAVSSRATDPLTGGSVGGDDAPSGPPRAQALDFRGLVDFSAPIAGDPPRASILPVSAAAGVPTRLRHLSNAAVVILAYNRPDHLKHALKALFSARLASQITTYVSIDGEDPATLAVIESEADEPGQSFTVLRHRRKELDPISKFLGGPTGFGSVRAPGTMYLAKHYKWALHQVLAEKGHSHAIVLEDDLVVSADFLTLFEQTAPLLEADPTIWCVSSWNDNGFKHLALPPDRLFRTAFFPGLGWMLRRELWLELEPEFPADQWDHWMRAFSTSRGRECVVPYLSRNRNTGIGGSTANGQFFRRYLQDIATPTKAAAPAAFGDLSYLLYDNYRTAMREKVAEIRRDTARFVHEADVYFNTEDDTLPHWTRALPSSPDGPPTTVVVPYRKETFEALSKQLGIYRTPRGFHQHSIVLYYKSFEVILMDKQLSPYLPQAYASLPTDGLQAVPAETVGQSCNDVCEKMEGGWDCAKDQFEFVNQCRVLQKVFGCRRGCRRDWGRDIPNLEHLTADESHFGGMQCLVTEEIPTCHASHPKTQRLCPCIPRNTAKRSSALRVTESAAADQSCDQTCRALGGGSYVCDAAQFGFVNSCAVLKEHFDCAVCLESLGRDLPNYVSSPS